jgi:PAS domain-containing protein
MVFLYLEGLGLLGRENKMEPSPSEVAAISLELQQVFDSGPSVECNIRQMLAILKTHVTFDIATYAEYVTETDTNGGTPALLVRGLYAQDGDTPFAWPSRWLRSIGGEVPAWLDSPEKRVADIEIFLNRSPEFAKLRDHEVVQTYLQRGARSFLIAVHKENGRVVSSLTLARREGAPFGPTEERLLDALQTSRVVRLIREAYRAQLTAFYREMRDLFEPDADPAAVAAHIVRRLCEQFRWDYVAIFRVARARSRFELITQFNSTDRRLTIEDENYNQPLHEGILSQVKADGRPRRIERLPPRGSSEKPPENYKRITEEAQSCMCYPIKLDGEVEWLLDCESAEIGAFQEPDERALEEFADDAEKTIALWFEMRLSHALLENVDVGVAVVDEEIRIQRINRAAAQLLGVGAASLPTGSDSTTAYGAIGRKLPTFGADEEASAVLRGSKVAAKPISLRGMDGRVRGVIVSSREADGAFNRRIWRLTNPTENEWARDLTYMSTTIQGVAQQTRGPLLLADALIAQARESGDDEARRALLGRARQCLARTDITYERLAVGRDVLRDPVRRDPRFWAAFDLGNWLHSFRDSLPESDQAALILRIPDGLPALWADHERLGFALRSTIGYLLCARQPEQVVWLDAAADNSMVSLTVSADGAAPKDLRREPPRDSIARFESEAWAAVLHAHAAAEKVITGHKGRVTVEPDGDAFRFRITNLRTARSVRHAGA